MAREQQIQSLTRRRLLLGATAIAASALAAACGQEPTGPIDASNASPTPAPSRVVVVSTPLPTSTPSLPTATPVGEVGKAFATPRGTPTTPLLVFAGGRGGNHFTPTESYPAQTLALLAPAKYDAVDLGVFYDTTLSLNNRASATIDPLYAASRSKNIVVAWDGINDLYDGATVAETFAGIVTFGQARRKVGFKVVMLTLLPALATAMPQGEAYETERQAINAMMRQNVASFADALADIGADPTIGTKGTEVNRDYYFSDGASTVFKGFSIIAGYVQKAILTL